jgi:deoxyribodipyrimidine photo-lyase
MTISVHWFRRDLRLEDNAALHFAIQSANPVLCLFIFDTKILKDLPKDDARVTFIYDVLKEIDTELKKIGSSLLIMRGEACQIWEEMLSKYQISDVFFNRDYEPAAIQRDKDVTENLMAHSVSVHPYKDQVIFEEHDVIKDDGKPYTVFTPYKKKWMAKFSIKESIEFTCSPVNFLKTNFKFPSLSEIGFKRSTVEARNYDLSVAANYADLRDLPSEDAGSYLGPHLRFGTVSIRQIIRSLNAEQEVFLSELIWREFFMQILFHFPEVVNHNFKRKYDGIQWRNNESEFEKWCRGETGYPMVDAGMRQLNESGYMHNRVRMVTASFLCKHLLIDWQWGESYFAEKLLDYELSSNNGNWQWAAGTGCDAAPYFRIFNPTEQVKKFDKDLRYIKKWVPEFDSFAYPKPIVDHKFARERALSTYKQGIQ